MPDVVQIGATSAATAVFASNAEFKRSFKTSPVPENTPVLFSATGGIVTPTNAETELGMAASTYTAGSVIGIYSVSATVDSETVSAAVEVVAWADLAVSIDPEVQYLDDGATAELTITVTNGGPVDAMGSAVVVDFPVELASAAWTCAGSGGGVCNASGTGDIDESADLPVGGSVVYTASGNAPDPFTGSLTVTASAATPAGVTDTDLENNQAEGNVIAVHIFSDGFESGDTSAWSTTVGLAP